MSPLEAVVVALGGNVALIAAIAWLARSILQNWLKKDVEAFKATLLSESSVATEKLRHGLSLAAVEHQVGFSKLHERRAEVIAEAYAKLVEAYWSMESFVSPVEFGCEPTKLEKYQDAMTKARDYFRYFDKNRIFLPAKLCDRLDEFLQGSCAQFLTRSEQLTPNPQVERTCLRHAAYQQHWASHGPRRRH